MKTLACALLGLLAANFLIPARADEKQVLVPSITVVGSDKVSANPDMAHIQVGVVTEASSAATSLKDNNDRMAKLFSSLEERGIARKDVQTSNLSVMPQYKRGPHGEQLSEIVAYRVSNSVGVKVRKLEALGQVPRRGCPKGSQPDPGCELLGRGTDPPARRGPSQSSR